MNRYLKQQGVAAVELAILLTFVLVPLLFGMTEFGRALYQYNGLTKATRDATRFLSTQGPGDPNDISAARCLAVYGNKACAGDSLVPNLTTAMVSVCDSSSCPSHLNQPTGSGVINLVTVTVSGYPFTSLAPFFVPAFTFGDISTTMRQVL
jgi:Flp pilus assembly protein TadG